ncbi:MAG: ABC transporter ATP-binding protein [Acidimicrobiaceae bacterium]|nr:ABC transporter ATP-binding protein [Acidimicrobiaceae bacterium]MYH76797.1 ABC transporter ATP-binding protein [Acidimicrobiaceae bacterium]MYK77135.1 ABC transporter ATP-binding protein [Acidimicrobiaceae bacterium]
MADQRTAGTEVPAVRLASISKSFGAIVACDHVDLTLYRGRIHGILGENGAGKSTLMKVLIGLVLPDGGTIEVDGERCQIRDPHDAATRGIGMVHQHFSLVEPLTVWENVMLGDTGRFDAGAARQRVAEISERYGLGVDPDAKLGDLSAGVRQRVEIIKCLRRDPSILIFDEPTSVLTPGESERLFDVLRLAVREENRAVALVSHKLDEILHATDEVTIMRAGSVVQRMETSEADAPLLARAMVGREVSLRSEASALGLIETVAAGAGDGEASRDGDSRIRVPALRLRDVVARGPDGRVSLDGLSVDVFDSEIVGVAGVEGNGQAALTDLLSSLLDADAGTVEVDGVKVEPGKPGAMSDAGVAVIPEDRHSSGCVLDMTVAENLFLVDIERIAKRGIYDPAVMRRDAARLIDDFDIHTAGPDAPFWSLSGGNQQRVVLARELSYSPKVLVASQPTRGLDVGAIEWMTDRLRQVADSGVAVMLISNELEEILQLSDRVVVLFRGRIIGEMGRADVDLEELGLLLGGADTEAAA